MDNALSKGLEIAFTVSEAVLARMTRHGTNLQQRHGSRRGILPLAATFAVDHDGEVVATSIEDKNWGAKHQCPDGELRKAQASKSPIPASTRSGLTNFGPGAIIDTSSATRPALQSRSLRTLIKASSAGV